MGSSADPEDPANSPARRLVEEQLADPDAAWAMGPAGASVRFARHPDEPVSRGPGSAVTDRGGVRLVLPDDAVAIAYETASPTDPLHWDHAVAFCLPVAAARGAGRVLVTELGPDRGALRPADTGGILFDLGVGGPYTDLMVRTSDPAALDALRAAAGRALVDVAATLGPALAGAAPLHRVAHGAGGRVESSRPLRVPLGELRAGPTHPASAPVPDGWVPCLLLMPAHPAMDGSGRPTPFSHERHTAFQALLAEHGDPVLAVLKAEVAAHVRANRGPENAMVADDGPGRATVAVAVRQLARTDGTSGSLAAWRTRFGV